MTFKEWLWEKEVFSSRHERAIEDMQLDPTNVSMWLEAAYNEGYEAGVEDVYKAEVKIPVEDLVEIQYDKYVSKSIVVGEIKSG